MIPLSAPKGEKKAILLLFSLLKSLMGKKHGRSKNELDKCKMQPYVPPWLPPCQSLLNIHLEADLMGDGEICGSSASLIFGVSPTQVRMSHVQ